MQGKVDSRAMREVNRSLLLDLIRRSGRVSRTDLARRSALTKPTVSAIVEELIAGGVVREVGLSESVPTGGRRARLLEFNDCSAAYLGVTLGAHTTRVAVADARGVLRATCSVPTPEGDARAVLDSALSRVDEVLRRADVPRERLQGVGVALGGLVDCRTGESVLYPQLGWRRVPVREVLQQRLGLPVTVGNVADAAALAEGRLGIAQGCRNYLWLYLGTSVSVGIVIEGQVYFGQRGFAGEIGALSVGRGSPTLDEVASGRALGERAAQLDAERPERRASSTGKRVSAGDLVRWALEGDPAARALLEEAGSELGAAVAQLVSLLDPELVVVGGPLLAAGTWLLDPLRETAEERLVAPLQTHIVPSELGESAVTAGAVFSAMDHVVQSYRIVAAAPLG